MKLDQQIIQSVLKKITNYRESSSSQDLPTLTFEQFYALLSPEEVTFCKQFVKIDPHTLGFLGPYLGIEEVPKDLVAINGQSYTRNGELHTMSTKYYPATAWVEFQKLQKAISKEIGSTLMINSGYRSPAYQVIVFFSILENNDFDLQAVGKRVALPGYSQHGSATCPAADVINQDGLPDSENPQDFAKTKEYDWLIKNATTFGFRLSYPENNEFGVIFEPWHWQWQGSTTS